MKRLGLLLILFMLGSCSAVEAPEGFRMNRYKAPVPASVKGAKTIDVDEAVKLHQQGVIFIDVISSGQLLTRGIENDWLVVRPHSSIPKSLWLPDVGRGALTPDQASYFEQALLTISEGAKDKALVFFCLKSCWMSWNAAKRAAQMGYKNLYWFPDGKDGWAEAGYELSLIEPYQIK